MGAWKDKGFEEAWWEAIWRHVKAHYGLPESARALLDHMNRALASTLAELERLAGVEPLPPPLPSRPLPAPVDTTVPWERS